MNPDIRVLSFSLKSPGKRIPSRFPPVGPHMERDARLQSLFYLSSRVPSKGAVPPSSHRERRSTSRPSSSHLSKSPLDEPTGGIDVCCIAHFQVEHNMHKTTQTLHPSQPDVAHSFESAITNRDLL